ncbi:DNA-binding MarR family transcriptional regulator [Leucobacter komagatae]|uniref:DNA-binding MarR family transcriptional regulator n=1 Tax=Leucobacter komagatae TaxID=55969 RepID=A0A542Y7A9_9MICO|nr:MarR family winged helix-turn-helix transcriptional regulator [Leucobacter komagatae]TQL43961.1 DNA-binding MarR family transcriptional regulator [Leucobacter komagatae]
MSSAAPEEEIVAGIISEFTEAFAFSRTRWTRYANEVSAELSGVSMLVLQIVFRRGPITATGVGHWLDMDKSLVSRHVAKLRDLGLIVATESPEDRRVQVLTVSEHATELLNGVRERWTNAYRERLADWSEEELESLRSGLHRFNASADTLPTDGPAARCARHAGDTGDTRDATETDPAA